MRSKDQILLENLYSRMVLKESPDTVYDNRGNVLKWNDNDAYVFGWFKLVPKMRPIYIRSLVASRVTHIDLGEFFSVSFVNKSSEQDIVYTLNAKPIRSDIPWDEVTDEIRFISKTEVAANGLSPWDNLVKGEVYKDVHYINTSSSDDEMYSRNEIFNNAGRIWLKSKVISFWNRIGEVSKDTVDSLMGSFNIPESDRGSFLIDVIDPQRLKDENTERKKLPTVSEYFGGKKEKAEEPLSKEQEKKIADLMAQKHIETDPAKRKQIEKQLGGSDEIKPWGSTLKGKRNPIWWQQAKYTSESYSR